MEKNDWGADFNIIMFLERLLQKHPNVERIIRTKDIYFTITRKNPSDQISILCCNEYTMGIAAVYRGLDEFTKIDVFYIGGEWNSYTSDAKKYCLDSHIGLYRTGEMHGALWKDE